MAKEAAISKRLKISEAGQYMVLAVLGTSIILGVGLAMIIHFVKYIAFNADVIAAAEASVANYSNVIEKIGVCTAPKGDIYTTEELKNCNPDTIDVSTIPGTLRANILSILAADESLNAVPNDNTDTGCINPETDVAYTYSELNENYNNAETDEEIVAAGELLKTCSALRVIPDALPAEKNEEALLASLNKIFNISNWLPESISPNRSDSSDYGIEGLNAIGVSLSIEADTSTTMTVLKNIERSIRTFDIQTASIEWSGTSKLTINAQATAYYTEESTLLESTKTIKPEGDTKK